MDILSVLALATQCVVSAPPSVVTAVTLSFDGVSAFSVEVDGQFIEHPNIDAAMETTAIALAAGKRLRLGLARIPAEDIRLRQHSYTEAFSPCHNLRLAGELLRREWQAFGSQDEHWRLAALQYATGMPGVESSFSTRFDDNINRVRATRAKLPGRSEVAPTSVASAGQPPLSAQNPAIGSETSGPTGPALSPVAAPPDAPANWNIYERSTGSSPLIFSK